MRRRLAVLVIGIGSAINDFGLGIADFGFWLLPDTEQVAASSNGAPDILHEAVVLSDPTEDLPHTG